MANFSNRGERFILFDWQTFHTVWYDQGGAEDSSARGDFLYLNHRRKYDVTSGEKNRPISSRRSTKMAASCFSAGHSFVFVFKGGAKVQVTGHRSGHRSGYRLQVTGHRLQVTGHRSQVTGHRLQVTGYRSQT